MAACDVLPETSVIIAEAFFNIEIIELEVSGITNISPSSKYFKASLLLEATQTFPLIDLFEILCPAT